MGKKSKKQENNGAGDAEEAPKPKKRSRAAAKTSAKKAPAKAAAKKPAVKRNDYEPSDEEIRLRAYLIAERRAQLSIAGDPANDWLAARKQLLEEAEQRRVASGVSI